jgi:hypothetical protein
MFDQTGAYAIFDVIASAIFDDDRFDTLQVQKPRQHKSSGPCSNNSDLRAHHLFPTKIRASL